MVLVYFVLVLAVALFCGTVHDKQARTLTGRLKQTFCWHDFPDHHHYSANEHGFEGPRFSDIVTYKCKKCDWVGFK